MISSLRPKIRIVDPLVLVGGAALRLSHIDDQFRQIQDYRQKRQEGYYLKFV